jgi:hypothetical protein
MYDEDDEIARNTEALIRGQISKKGQKEIAARTPFSETKVCRINSGEAAVRIGEMGPFLDSMDLKLVHKSAIVIPPEEYEALKLFARKGLE